MRVLAFNASPKPDGNTSILLRTALSELEKEGIETELIHIGGRPLRGCTACGQCSKTMDGRCALPDDGINGWIARIREADGIILGTPTYFADVTSEMKAFIDRVGYVCRSNNNLLQRKVGAAVVAVRRCGSIHAFDTINHFFLIAQMIVPGSSYWNMGIGRTPGEVGSDEEGIRTMETLGKNMAWLISRVGGER
ncbi:MAG: flavodoxin family protein [Thermovirgaceae bacterium]|nr:flavodoxin family protein [Thermovirgaceae bacterium]